ncbi:hypothetical protein NEMIN01_0533 [Nematocida minor]|uniref:uncharacterized protein n=1 Tax=Nematocida minor TaxID=1912983 RepID=UPI002220EA5D|nr:uncharacterized protein NEMIN01_0533 [Nematocida minor]KAI5189470.1 hypothetical protein NEMIN01_0533 [Nematocida minor]
MGKGRDLHFSGMVLSNNLKALIWVLSVAMIVHITFLLVTFITDPDKASKLTAFFLNVTITSHILLIMLFTLLVLQGLLERDIFQVFFSTLFTSIVCILQIVAAFDLEIELFTVLYAVNNIIPIACGVLIIYLICFTSELRAEVGWFYYKSYGAKYNTRHAIRRSMETFYKLNLQMFLSYWIVKYYTTDVKYLLGIETALYACLLFLINLEYEFVNNYFIRFMTIIVVGVLFAYYLAGSIDYTLVVGNRVLAEMSDLERAYQRFEVTIKLVISGIYCILLILDTMHFAMDKRMENGGIGATQKKRILIS